MLAIAGGIILAVLAMGIFIETAEFLTEDVWEGCGCLMLLLLLLFGAIWLL